MTEISRAQIEILIELMDSAFDGDEWDSFLGNLRSTQPDDWDWIPDGGSRTIRQIVRHVGTSRIMYDNHAFGNAKLTYDDLADEENSSTADLASAIEWLREGHLKLRSSVASLSDSDLDKESMMNWGEMKNIRYVIAIMIHHDVYHAGEINMLRSLRSRDDRWEYAK